MMMWLYRFGEGWYWKSWFGLELLHGIKSALGQDADAFVARRRATRATKHGERGSLHALIANGCMYKQALLCSGPVLKVLKPLQGARLKRCAAPRATWIRAADCHYFGLLHQQRKPMRCCTSQGTRGWR